MRGIIVKHVGTFAFRFLLSLTYALSPDLNVPSSMDVEGETRQITKTYEWSVYFDKDDRPAGLNLWETAQKDIEEECKESGIQMWDTRALTMSTVKVVPKIDIDPLEMDVDEGTSGGQHEHQPEASGSGSHS
jgi:hypothetical protein